LRQERDPKKKKRKQEQTKWEKTLCGHKVR
jgi:hypothetical protein